MSNEMEEFLASDVEFSIREVDDLTLLEERPLQNFPTWLLGTTRVAVVAATLMGVFGQVSQARIAIPPPPRVQQSQGVDEQVALGANEIFSRPQDHAGLAELMLRAPRLESVDHLLD